MSTVKTSPETERFYSIRQIAEMFPGRSRRWVEDRVKAGEFGPALNAGGWLIPWSGVREYIRSHSVDFAELSARAPSANLIQFHHG